jgi:predicted Zn-dependent protease
VDFEIVFNTQFAWGTDGTLSVMDLQNIATHELGHGFGLADLYEDQWSEQTMYGYGSYGEIKKRTLESGDIAGIQKLYGR